MNENLSIVVGSRASKLSLKQVEEVLYGIQGHHPHIKFILKCCQTIGDKDQQTSLRDLGPTDFFTKELDEWLLKGKCRITIHSAKDLPEPLPKGVQLIALTQNKNNQDVLVLPSNNHSKMLLQGAKVGVSSIRREEMVKNLFPHVGFKDLRGTIERRIEKITTGELDGVVIAKVALMRLGLANLNMIDLPGKPPPLQGSLAILAREGDLEMQTLFSAIDSRIGKKSLYLGLNPQHYLTSGSVTHYPMIKIKPRPFDSFALSLHDFHDFTHLIFTSTTTVNIFFEFLDQFEMFKPLLKQKKVIAVGEITALSLKKRGVLVDYIAKNEAQEGIIHILNPLRFSAKTYFFYPKSSLARPKLLDYMKDRGLRYKTLDFYDTVFQALKPLPSLEDFNEIVFTSPSTVNSFFETFKSLPNQVTCVFKGQVTKDHFNKRSEGFLIKS